jgi:hypothetical protein
MEVKSGKGSPRSADFVSAGDYSLRLPSSADFLLHAFCYLIIIFVIFLLSFPDRWVGAS